jgi:hypothetical protein
MHIAATAIDDSASPLETVLTASASRAQFRDLWTRTEQPDEYSSPGPVRTIALESSNGHSLTVVFHERKNSIEVLAAPHDGIESDLAELLHDLTVAPEAITWTHASVDRTSLFALR